MRYLAVLIVALWPALLAAAEWEDHQTFGDTEASAPLRILSSTDTSFFAPIIAAFVARQPGVAVEYLVTGTADLDARFRDAPAAYDVVISSAMDLQLKLANDGFAAPLDMPEHPDRAQWHKRLFGFTTEPAAIVVNKELFADLPLPRSRQDLIEVLRANPERFTGKVGTYDVRDSGLGYLFATQDARSSETFWRLMEVMGRLDARLYCCSGEMIDDLATGRLAVAYNVLGSYAEARATEAGALTVILPSEFPTAMMRTALISRAAPQPEVAKAFLRHLIQMQAGGGDAGFPLPPLATSNDATGGTSISLDPALMTYLDRMKRQMFIQEWENAIVQQD
ncbi:ABC transporter substrate-binding protein [Thalassorhabdomicrobium marinisediminis]|uniref:ABC transporter substrate-binding protein n=1 Tax=Thalassorhabdomicrobium marinisediminis TaxID=2170577 RepID=A0A2T7FT98_9RHOB|nr:ABC transporter substrate-binding protein [Thalassorhabdomicrobium marinisediminis]PVA05398.1 ABC transporter substrate-binding protein [Thalassorhabdomicrobium marinisediminis]